MLQHALKIPAFELDTQSVPFYRAGRNGQVPHHVGSTCTVHQAVRVERNTFQECWQFVFQNVNVNVTCKPLYASVMQLAECYRQVQSSNFKVPKLYYS